MSAFLPESDSEDELPPGWEERATLQGEVSNWQFWQPIIWEWNVLFCIPSLLQVYYANHDQSSTQWQHPRTGRRKTVGENLPFGWERKILSDNKVFLLLPQWFLTMLLFEVVYVNLAKKKTTFTDPRLAFAKETVTASTTFRQKFDSGSTALQVCEIIQCIASISGEIYLSRWPMAGT